MSLVHRYRFDGDSTAVIDEVGGQDGVRLGGAVLDGSGRLTLDGEDDFVDREPARRRRGADLNDWLGQSQWENDHTYNGRYDEFRGYDEALTPCAIASLFVAAPETLP